MVNTTFPDRNNDICAVAGHAWRSKSDTYGRWLECMRCGAKRSTGAIWSIRDTSFCMYYR